MRITARTVGVLIAIKCELQTLFFSNYELSKLINFKSVGCSWQYLILTAYCRNVAFLLVVWLMNLIKVQRVNV
jgi:hypothetical protein